MKRFAFFRKNNQIFARFITPDAKYERYETVFDCDNNYGIIMIKNGETTTETFYTEIQAVHYINNVTDNHEDYKAVYCDDSDLILEKGNDYITIKIVC